MNIQAIMGKAQNVFSQFKGKGSEIKSMIDGMKKNSGLDSDEMTTRSVVAKVPVETEEEEKPKNNMAIYLAIGAVVLFMLMKKK